jgi:hypothetical protein
MVHCIAAVALCLLSLLPQCVAFEWGWYTDKVATPKPAWMQLLITDPHTEYPFIGRTRHDTLVNNREFRERQSTTALTYRKSIRKYPEIILLSTAPFFCCVYLILMVFLTPVLEDQSKSKVFACFRLCCCCYLFDIFFVFFKDPCKCCEQNPSMCCAQDPSMCCALDTDTC